MSTEKAEVKDMSKGNVIVYYGDGKGKTTSALGYAIQAASQGRSVIIIQFLKGKNDDEMAFIRRLEPEIKFFRFEKSHENFELLSEEQKAEEIMNIKNGLNFARKVLLTGECSVLILDELLGLIDNHVISNDELDAMLQAKSEETEIIFTGREMDASLSQYADEIYEIHTEKSGIDKNL